jgi:hypothetical protein
LRAIVEEDPRRSDSPDSGSQSTSVQDVIETALASTAFLDDPRIRYDMAKGGAIDFGALHHEITTIYLVLPVHELQNQSKWLRLFVNQSLRELYKHLAPANAPLPPILYLVDEFDGRAPIGAARVRVANVGGEEFKEAVGGALAAGSDKGVGAVGKDDEVAHP